MATEEAAPRVPDSPHDTVALVTGAGHNIGAGIAAGLAAAGSAVVLLDKDEQAAAQVAGKINANGGRALAVAGDVTRSADFARAVDQARDSFGVVNILINNAGVWVNKSIMEHTEEDFDKVIATNLRGVFVGARAVIPGMIAAGWGRIVNITSIAAFHYTIPHASYSAAKAGIVAFTRDLAVELAPHGITVNAVAPGSIPSGDPGPAPGYPMGLGNADDIAAAVEFFTSPRSRYTTGTTLPVAGAIDLMLGFGTTHERRLAMLGHEY